MDDSGKHASPEQMQRKHIYVLNGSPEFLDIIRQLLQEENYNVTTTNFVPTSFATIEAARPDLLIVDLVQGEAAGWDLLKALQQGARTRGTPLILISTSPAYLDQARDQHVLVGGDRYLTKPFNLEDLLTAAEELIGKA